MGVLIMENKVIKSLITFFLCLNSYSIIYSKIYQYIDNISNKNTVRQFQLEHNETGYETFYDSKEGFIMKTKADNDFNLVEWILINTNDKTDVRVVRQNQELLVKGISKGQKIDKKFKIDQDPWYEDWGLGLVNFILSTNNSTLFWSMPPTDVNLIAKFRAEKKEIQNILIGQEKVEVYYVKIAIDGPLSVLFSTDYWFRKSDGVHVKMKLQLGPGGPIVISILKEIKD